MKKFFTFLFFLIVGFCFNPIFSQALYPVGIDEKILNSSLIIEGKVLERKSFWDPVHRMIYTANKVEVYKAFKGVTPAGTIEVMTEGGTVGTEIIEASDLLTLEKDNIGVFFCYPNATKLISPFTGNQLFDVYSSAQGSFTYNLSAKTASAPFVHYPSIVNGLYKELIQKTGHQPIIINSAFDISGAARPQTPLAPVITSFSPQTVNAGAVLDPSTNLLTINGSGFGNTPGGTSAVLFDDGNDGSGGTPWTVAFNSPLIQSWTDNQITVRVPSRAGSGNVEVRDELGASAIAPGILNVNYSVLTTEVADGGTSYVREFSIMNDNGTGGYTVLFSSSADGSGINLDASAEKGTVQRALTTWKEIVGFNVVEGGATASQTIAGDGQNLVTFDSENSGKAPMAAGVLATCYSYGNFCPPVSINQVQKTEFDILIRNNAVSLGSTSFQTGPCAPPSPYNLTDLETVLLHELGHALNLGHINDTWEGASAPNINAPKLMNYAVRSGVVRKSPDYSALVGAIYCITPQNSVYGSCTLSSVEMTPLARTIVAQDECPLVFPTVSTPVSTVINFDLVHATSNKYGDPAYTGINCLSTGTSVTNNAYFVFRSDADGGDLNMVVSGYATTPVEGSGCVGAGARLAIYEANSCPAGQAFPSPLFCRSITRNGNLSAITALAPNTNYIIYVDGLDNTKLNFSLTLNGTVLPVTLVDFKGIISNSTVNLSWKTSSEINSKEFIVEKSLDGALFNAFTAVSAKGNSNSVNNYGVIDDNPFSGFTFYRLKIVDKDGRFQYSGIVKISTPRRSVVIQRIFPNPTSGKLNFQVVADSRKSLTIEIFDLLGKKVTNLSLSVEQGLNEKPVFVNTLTAGAYFIQVKDASGIVIEKSKFIKN